MKEEFDVDCVSIKTTKTQKSGERQTVTVVKFAGEEEKFQICGRENLNSLFGVDEHYKITFLNDQTKLKDVLPMPKKEETSKVVPKVAGPGKPLVAKKK